MRKRILTLLLCAAMLFGMVPNVVAAEAPATIGTEPAAEEVYATQDSTSPEEWVPADISTDEGIDSDPRITLAWETGSAEWKNNSWSSALPSGVTYAADTHTLTLNRANLTRLELVDFADTPVTVQVEGKNTIASSAGTSKEDNYTSQVEIRRCNSVTFTGGGSLSVTKVFTGGPTVFDSAEQGTYTSAAFVAQDAYIFNSDTAILTTGPQSRLCFDGVSINVEDQFQQSTLDVLSEPDKTALLSFTPGWTAEIDFGNIDFVNHAAMTINGQLATVMSGNVTIAEGSSLITAALDIRSHIAASSSTVTVNGSLCANGNSKEIIQKQYSIAKEKLPDYKIYVVASAEDALCIGENVTLQLAGGDIAAYSNEYTAIGISIVGNAVIQSGKLTVSQGSPQAQEDYEPSFRLKGIGVLGGTLIQNGGSIDVSYSDVNTSNSMYAIDCLSVIRMDGTPGRVELNSGAFDIRLPKTCRMVDCFAAFGGTIRCTGTNITVSSSSDAKLSDVYLVGGNFYYGGGTFDFTPQGTIDSISVFDANENEKVQIAGGTFSIDMSQCTNSSFYGARIYNQGMFTASGGALNFGSINSSFYAVVFKAGDDSSLEFSAGTVDISAAGASMDGPMRPITGISASGSSTVTINGSAKFKLDAASSLSSKGIQCYDTAKLSISGAPVVDIDTYGSAISIVQGGIGEISGGTVRINQQHKASTTGISISEGTLTISGGETYIWGKEPLSSFHDSSVAPVILADGVNANILEADGTALRAVTVVDETFDNSDIVFSYYSDPMATDPDAPFGVLIRRQSSTVNTYKGSIELANAGVIISGSKYQVRYQADLTTYAGDIAFTLSNGMQLVPDSVSVNGVKAAYTLSDNQLTVHMNTGDVIRFEVIPAAGSNTVTASTGAPGESETISFDAAEYTFTAPTDTNRPEVFVSGSTIASAAVDIYVNDVLASTTTASMVGNWISSVTMNLGDNVIYIIVTPPGNTPIRSESKIVSFAPDDPVPEKFTFSNWIHGATSIDPNEEITTELDFATGKFSRDYYTYWPDLPSWRFTLTFANGTGTPEQIKDVLIIATDANGKTKRMGLSYDYTSGSWVGLNMLASTLNIVPNRFRVEWHSVYESTFAPYHATKDYTIVGIADPSGYVYEGIPSFRLRDVTVGVYQNGVLWADAASYEQKAEQLTDELGQYLWMVPDGTWKVKYHKDGYEDAESASLVVPPVYTDVNQCLVSRASATLEATYDPTQKGIVLRFSRPVQVSSVSSIVLKDVNTGESITGFTIVPIDAELSVPTNASDFTSTLCTTTYVVKLSDETNRSIAIDASQVVTYANVSCTQAQSNVAYGVVPKHTVTVINGTGSRSEVPVGEVVTIRANAGSFYFWKVECAGNIAVSVPATATAQFTMPDADITLTAIYYEEAVSPTPGTTPSDPTPTPTPSATPAPSAPAPSTTPAPTAYTISTGEKLKNGSIKVTSGDTSEAGKDVTFTVTPAEGYKIATVTVTDKDGKQITVKDLGDGKYQFVMPAGTVKIGATFEHVCLAEQFTDLDVTQWYHEAVDYVLRHGLMSGVGGDLFAPTLTTDRAMLTTILYNLEERPAVTEASTFEDVEAGKYYADPVAWAQANKVVAGTSDTTFSPTEGITREQMAMMLYNYAVLKGYDVSKTDGLDTFADANAVSDWAKTACGWATANGILNGVSTDPTAKVLNPQGASSRAEMAAVIKNFLTVFVAEQTAE